MTDVQLQAPNKNASRTNGFAGPPPKPAKRAPACGRDRRGGVLEGERKPVSAVVTLFDLPLRSSACGAHEWGLGRPGCTMWTRQSPAPFQITDSPLAGHAIEGFTSCRGPYLSHLVLDLARRLIMNPSIHPSHVSSRRHANVLGHPDTWTPWTRRGHDRPLASTAVSGPQHVMALRAVSRTAAFRRAQGARAADRLREIRCLGQAARAAMPLQ